MAIHEAIQNLQFVMNENGVDPTKGLPQELFLFATTMIPCANIDLFVTDENRRLLLTWRDDEFYGQGRHIPGGCLRLKETLDNRIQQTAINELGSKAVYDKDNFITRETMVTEDRPWLTNELERCHNISMPFFCRLPKEYEFKNKENDEHTRGYLKRFDQCQRICWKHIKDSTEILLIDSLKGNGYEKRNHHRRQRIRRK